MVTAIEGTGTTEAHWRPWLADRQWPQVSADSFEHPLVVAPHPDDEILGVGGLLATIRHAVVVAVTDGEASHPNATSVTAADLARLRPAESDEALTRLRVNAHTHRLRQPDGAIDEKTLIRAVADLLAPNQPCLSTWRGDGHPDHEAVSRACAEACQRTGAVLWEYPVWMWHWSRPADPRVPWHAAHRIPLAHAAIAAKTHAVGAFTTQIADIDGTTILPPSALARFERPFEVLFR
jgi:LmbE family N-acetylglucosaminyl deacetylase